MGELRLETVTEGERIDAFLASSKPEHSRSYWQKLCETGRVLVNGKPVKASHKLAAEDKIAVKLPEARSFEGQKLPIIYQDDDVIVINKPAGVLTHAKGAESQEFSVAEFVRPLATDGTGTNRPGIVHRLDRATSGVIIAAKTPDAKRWLQGQFSKRNVKKTYLALVEGQLKDAEAIIKLPIERNPRRPQTFRIGPNGKPAETAYKLSKSYQGHDLVELSPHTGRTHQLRVHMQHLGHPIVGDPLYGQPDEHLGRMFLHAHRLELTLPSRDRKVFVAPLPPELQNYLNGLK